MKLSLSNLRSFLFPAPATKYDAIKREQLAIEQSATLVSKQITLCKRLSDTYDAMDAISDFRHIWGNKIQVNCWHDSLILMLRNKQDEIIAAM